MDQLRWENIELRSLLARCHAELIETKLAASRDRTSAPLDAAVTIRDLLHRLRFTAEALAEANAACQQAAERIDALTQALSDREDLIRSQNQLSRETDHRVKNSLQDIISLIRIQADRERNHRVLAFAASACARLEALATAHELLCTSHSVDRLDARTYLERLCAALSCTLEADGRWRTLILEAASVTLPCGAAQALALVVNELVTNAFRHAFDPGQPGTVRVQLSQRKATALLTVADDGRGLPDGGTLQSGQGLGLWLVATMADQLGARITVVNKAGSRITLAIPMKADKAHEPPARRSRA